MKYDECLEWWQTTNEIINTNRILTAKQNETVSEAAEYYAVGTGVAALISIVLNFIYVTCLNVAAENQVSISKSSLRSRAISNQSEVGKTKL